MTILEARSCAARKCCLLHAAMISRASFSLEVSGWEKAEIWVVSVDIVVASCRAGIHGGLIAYYNLILPASRKSVCSESDLMQDSLPVQPNTNQINRAIIQTC